MAFVLQALILFIFVKIHIVKRQKETPFPYLCLKLFVDCQRISQKHLLDGFVYNQNAYMIKILYHVLGSIVSINKVAHCDL